MNFGCFRPRLGTYFMNFKMFGHFTQLGAPVFLIVHGNSLIMH